MSLKFALISFAFVKKPLDNCNKDAVRLLLGYGRKRNACGCLLCGNSSNGSLDKYFGYEKNPLDRSGKDAVRFLLGYGRKA